MTEHFLKETDFPGFVAKLMALAPVIGPVAKKHKFTFEILKKPDELRLDYDVTILPPKKAIFPVKQKLVEFTDKGFTSALWPKTQILLGVHFYDIKAIDMLDFLFKENNADNNYLAYRKETTIVGSNIQTVSERAFFGTVGAEVKPKGHDAFLTKISGGYLFEVFTDKGKALLKQGAFTKASAEQNQAAKQVNEDVLTLCKEKLEYSSETIAVKMRNAFKNEELWTELSKDCFACGTCNIVCPTCYCFDVQDKWNLDQKSGYRYRAWDGCLLEDFSKVSLGAGGATENFRESKAQRYRHRMMRKATYLNEKLEGPACVGCGRCSVGCVPDIADPVKIIKKVIEG